MICCETCGTQRPCPADGCRDYRDEVEKKKSFQGIIIQELETRIKLIRSAKNELSEDNFEIYDRWYAGKIQAHQETIEFIKSL